MSEEKYTTASAFVARKLAEAKRDGYAPRFRLASVPAPAASSDAFPGTVADRGRAWNAMIEQALLAPPEPPPPSRPLSITGPQPTPISRLRDKHGRPLAGGALANAKAKLSREAAVSREEVANSSRHED